MITVNHLTKRYGSHLAVDDISFTVPLDDADRAEEALDKMVKLWAF